MNPLAALAAADEVVHAPRARGPRSRSRAGRPLAMLAARLRRWMRPEPTAVPIHDIAET